MGRGVGRGWVAGATHPRTKKNDNEEQEGNMLLPMLPRKPFPLTLIHTYMHTYMHAYIHYMHTYMHA